ncbi:MAG TPA: helix-turn-helix domain-containing protein, partial [Candidatus Wallbacteria bacterium]|nr:helix-turn-helix domain-containing protein [Candidatus Wallbacteria bacterium]
MERGIIKSENPKKKDAVLKAAIEIFSKKGYPAATIREIGARAGVSTGTIYFMTIKVDQHFSLQRPAF